MYSYRKLPRSISQTCNINKLRAAFRLSDAFFNSSLLTEDKRLKDLYQYNSVMMYYWTLQTIATDAYYPKRKEIIDKLGIENLRKNTLIRKKQTSVPYKCLPFLYLSPTTSIWLTKYMNKLIQILK